jgi:hypothetical protein
MIYDMIWYDIYDMVWYSVVWYSMVWYMVWYMAWHNMESTELLCLYWHDLFSLVTGTVKALNVVTRHVIETMCSEYKKPTIQHVDLKKAAVVFA